MGRPQTGGHRCQFRGRRRGHSGRTAGSRSISTRPRRRRRRSPMELVAPSADRIPADRRQVQAVTARVTSRRPQSMQWSCPFRRADRHEGQASVTSLRPGGRRRPISSRSRRPYRYVPNVSYLRRKARIALRRSAIWPRIANARESSSGPCRGRPSQGGGGVPSWRRGRASYHERAATTSSNASSVAANPSAEVWRSSSVMARRR